MQYLRSVTGYEPLISERTQSGSEHGNLISGANNDGF
jgi:hypothetical protein